MLWRITRMPGDNSRAIDAFVKAYVKRGRFSKFDQIKAGRAILRLEPQEQVEIVCQAFKGIGNSLRRMSNRGGAGDWADANNARHGQAQLSVELLKRDLPFRQRDFVWLMRTAMNPRTAWPDDWPVEALVRAIGRFADNCEISDSLNKALQEFIEFLGTGSRAETRNLSSKLVAIIGARDGAPDIMLIKSDWANRVVEYLYEQDEDSGRLWLPVFRRAREIEHKTKPTANWFETVAATLTELGTEKFTSALGRWFGPSTAESIYQDPNTDLIKAIIWIASRVEDDRMPSVLGQFCETCYRKIPGVGPASIKLGNACIYALGQMPGERAVAELVRLRSRIKFNQGRKTLNEALTGAAERAGLPVEDLEEIALPAFGLGPDGGLTEALGNATAEIRIEGTDEVVLNWTGADGKPRKSVPASVREHHADEVKALRARVKEIKGLLSGQRYRLESLYLRDRSWPLEQWRERYLEHPLLAGMARRLIWNFGDVAAIPSGEGLVDVGGKPFQPAANAVVSLWHPIGVAADRVLAWRRRLAALEITQPFKQAHREIYVLTEAERATQTYSNRFAAHILRQHQFSALCRARGWRYSLQGEWDSHNVPERRLPDRDLSVSFAVDPVAIEERTEMSIYHYVTTDRVAFHGDAGALLDLAEVPPLLFSEMMRDVDLFVGVASIGNDPEWQDRGPEGAFIEYWHSYGFGDLGETAKTRRAVLEELLPKLKIADVCELEDRFLKVRGTKRTYRIHLGSGNIQMEPNNQYLCIVPGGVALADYRIRLPFEGDGVLSIILSKAFLLAEDDKITDRTILNQIGR